MRCLDQSQLCKPENASICLLSSKSRNELSAITGKNIIIAEHGLWVRLKPEDNWIENENFSSIHSISSLAEPILKVLKYYSIRVPNSKVEASEEFICWNFDCADRFYADWIASELQMNLEKFIGHLPLKVDYF